jgi:pimeloyl-ACP methyl ester carboxylesterase
VPTVAFTPTFAKHSCTFKLPGGRTDTNTFCGTLTVLADRTKPAGTTIQLAVAVLPALGAKPLPDPIVYLDGGPGGETLGGSSDFFSTSFAADLQQQRDIILFDQRGVGLSKPSLDCPEYTDALYATLTAPLTRDQVNARDETSMEACRQRLVAQGVDLSWFSSTASAADVHDLMRTIGYSEWNLLGVSYGTRLGLTILRDQPDGVRSAVLDSVYPPFVDRYVDLPYAAQRAFDTLFQGCAADPACAKAYPKLDERFYALVRRLDAKPLIANARNYTDGKNYDVRIDGTQLVNMLFTSLYITDFIADLPDLIARADAETARGETAALGEWGWVIFLFDGLSEGDYYAVECSEETPFNQIAALEQAAKKVHPELKSAFGDPEILRYCQKWATRPADPRENQPIQSAIPTLLLAGQYDPVTPPEYASRAAKTLDHSTVVEFPGLGHATFAQPCPISIYTAFINTPTAKLDVSCVNQMSPPPFRVPS